MGYQFIIKKLIQKPEVGLNVNFTRLTSGSKDMSIALAEQSSRAMRKADLGTTAYQIGEELTSKFPHAKTQVDNIFGHLNSVEKITNRPKGPVSIITKLERGIKQGKINSYDTALKYIGDGVGSRIITKPLPKLSKNQIKAMINDIRINGSPLSSSEKKLLQKYIYNQPMPQQDADKAFPLFEKFAQPLIEQRSKQVVDDLSISIAANRIKKGELSIHQIKEQGLLKEELINRLESETIEDLEVLLINNYRGGHGLPEFSSRQIQALRKICGNNVIINSRPDLAGYSKFPNYKYTKEEVKKFAVKASGYRTAQMNIIHSNGVRGELQFRGPLTNYFGEYEHIAYDLRQGKNTLGPLFNDYKREISKLPDWKYEKYNAYLEGCYNYYYRLELGLPAAKPKLPKGFNKVLSEENMKKLHEANEKRLSELKTGFKAHFEEVA